MSGVSDDAKRNRASWTKANTEFTDEQANRAWRAETITWGVFAVPEESLQTLGNVDGLDVVELGCGTAYVSAWLARRGARPVGVDVTLYPPEDAIDHSYYDTFSVEWSRKWPSEEIWVAAKRS